jgi:hypothetical protein
VIKYDKDSNPQYDLILGTETMKEYGIILDFNSLTAMDGRDHPLKN